MRADEQEAATTKGLGAARKPKPIPRAENVPLLCVGSQCLDLPKPSKQMQPVPVPCVPAVGGMWGPSRPMYVQQ